MRPSLFSPLSLALFAALHAPAQATLPSVAQNDPQLSPKAAYQDALHPLEATRRNIANWSDVELAAMNVAVAQAKSACIARRPADYTGAGLIDLARLCSLGQQWPAVLNAASQYIAAIAQPKPLLTDAYIAQTEAHLRLKQEPAALQSELALLAAVPYTPDVGDCTDEVLAYMRFVYTADALTVARARQPVLLHALALANQPAPPATAPSTATPALASPTLHELYTEGLELPTLLQLAAESADAEYAFDALNKALPATLSPDDALRVAASRRQYALLGKPLTGVVPLTSLSSPANKLPAIPARRPDPKLTNTAFNPAYAAAMLAETPTVTVSPETLARFEATDFPLLLITDPDGILRVLQPITAQDLQPGGDIDAAIALIGRNFSRPAPSTATTPRAPSSTP